MRVRVTDVLELLAVGITADQIVSEELPYLKKEDISACLIYAATKINHPVLTAA
jgi:uncharacterized protein (DUF433 family)